MAVNHGAQHTTRPFAAGAFEFEVATTRAEDRQMVEALFADLPEPSRSDRTQRFVLRFDPRADPVWLVSGPRVGEEPASQVDVALVYLMAAVNLCALDAEPEHLHLHAAAATRSGRAVVVAAERNTGKTTTIAHLVARGWGFVTDETVRLPADPRRIGGFPKPLSIKPYSSALVEHFAPWMIPPVGQEDGLVRFVPVGASGASVVDGGTPHLVVLLKRPFDDRITGPAVKQLHPADAVVALMQETLDAERHGAAALRLAELAARSQCVELTIGTPAETADTIEHLFDAEPAAACHVALLPPSEAVSPGVVSVALGDRAVLHDTETGRVLALDEGATRIWRRVGGWNVDDEIDLDAPVIRPFVAQLRALGLLASAA